MILRFVILIMADTEPPYNDFISEQKALIIKPESLINICYQVKHCQGKK